MFQKGTIKLTNGDSTEAYIRVYDYNILQSQLKFEYEINGVRVKIKSKEISKVVFGNKTFEKLKVIKKRANAYAPSSVEIYDTTFFFATRANTTEPKIYAHYSCGTTFTYNSGNNKGSMLITTYLTPSGSSYQELTDAYYSTTEDPDMRDTPHLYSERLNTFIYLKPQQKQSNTNSTRPGMRH